MAIRGLDCFSKWGYETLQHEEEIKHSRFSPQLIGMIFSIAILIIVALGASGTLSNLTTGWITAGLAGTTLIIDLIGSNRALKIRLFVHSFICLIVIVAAVVCGTGILVGKTYAWTFCGLVWGLGIGITALRHVARQRAQDYNFERL